MNQQRTTSSKKRFFNAIMMSVALYAIVSFVALIILLLYPIIPSIITLQLTELILLVIPALPILLFFKITLFSKVPLEYKPDIFSVIRFTKVFYTFITLFISYELFCRISAFVYGDGPGLSILLAMISLGFIPIVGITLLISFVRSYLRAKEIIKHWND